MNRLMELEDQMGKFKNAIGDSIRKGGGQRRLHSGYDDRSPSKKLKTCVLVIDID